METTKETTRQHQFILQTLQLAEQRGYNLTIEQLSQFCQGGQIPLNELTEHVNQWNDLETDGVFLATKGNLYLEKCRRRAASNILLEPLYHRIATEFVNKYVSICPWVNCMMISGSMASGGLGEGDDIDFDIVVDDGYKYSSYLLALLLSGKYSLKYGKQFWRHYVICISVIWEHHQVLPFLRNDGQMAFELLNAKVVYNQQFFHYMLNQNRWLISYFPQLYQLNETTISSPVHHSHKKGLMNWFLETFAKSITFVGVRIGMHVISQDEERLQRNAVKHPYTFFDYTKKS